MDNAVSECSSSTDTREAIRMIAQSYLNREDEDWTWIDPEDVKRLARAVIDSDQFKFDEARIAKIERFRP